MGYNHNSAEKKFAADWEKTEKMCKQAGMSAVDIAKIYEFDREVFNSDRRYLEHTEHVDIEISSGEEESNQSIYLREHHTERFALEMDSLVEKDRFAWVDEIGDEQLAEAVASMDKEDLDIITMLVFEGYKGKEIAEMKGVSPQAISKKIKKLKKFLKNF